jgi:hypothetical protein
MFATYSDIGFDVGSGLVFGASSYWQDPAAGCNHYNEVLTTTLFSPSSAQDVGYGWAGLPFNDEEGYWETDGYYTATCDCVFFQQVETGDQIIKLFEIKISSHIAPVIPISDATSLCYYGDFYCSSGTPTCADEPEWNFVFHPPGSDCWFAIACRWVRAGGHCFQPLLQNCWEPDDPVVCT